LNDSIKFSAEQAAKQGSDGGPTEARRGNRRSPLSTAHIRPKSYVEYVRGASRLTVSRGADNTAVGGGRRGAISGFSRASRLRLMRLIAGVRRDANLPCFVTLTYPDRFPSCARAKRDLKIFLQRLRRRFEGAGAIWKLEPQARGAPHYHLLVWGVDEIDLVCWTVRAWHEIAGDGDPNHLAFHSGQLSGSRLCVEGVRSWRGVWAYASKYLGKTFVVAEWGDKWTGRFWGVCNRSGIPFGETIRLDVAYAHAVVWMRYQRRFAHLRGRRMPTVTTFCDADQWVGRMAIAGRGEPPAGGGFPSGDPSPPTPLIGG